MRRLRLCYVGWADHVHVERWASYFARLGHDVTVISFSGRGRYPNGVRQYSLGLHRRGPRSMQFLLRLLLAVIRPDIVHVHWAHFAVHVSSAWNGPLVVTAWGSDIYNEAGFGEATWASLGGALRRAHLVTCDSKDLARAIRLRFSLREENVVEVQWGVDTDLFAPEGPNLRAELGLDGAEVVLSPRNLRPVYNQETVIAAFAALRERRPAAYLLMKNYRGDPAYVEHIRSVIGRRGLERDVKILDAFVYERMPSLYRSADVMVSIPRSDATPMSLLEAMATGLPAVVSDLPSLRQWIQPGRTGYIVDPNDAAAVTRALDTALGDAAKRSQVGTYARAVAIERASQSAHMEIMARRYDALV